MDLHKYVDKVETICNLCRIIFNPSVQDNFHYSPFLCVREARFALNITEQRKLFIFKNNILKIIACSLS